MRIAHLLPVLAACGGSSAATPPRAPIANAEPAAAAAPDAPAAPAAPVAPAAPAAPVAPGAPGGALASLTGAGYRKDNVRDTIKAHVAEIRGCYEKALLVHPGLAGRVDTIFTIGRGGAVSGATATGVAPEVDACIAQVIGSLTFPAPLGGSVRVAYPFTFSAK